jgi:hypothetical protein
VNILAGRPAHAHIHVVGHVDILRAQPLREDLWEGPGVRVYARTWSGVDGPSLHCWTLYPRNRVGRDRPGDDPCAAAGGTMIDGDYSSDWSDA